MTVRIPQRGLALTHEVRGTDQTVLYDESGNQLRVLNETGAAIWLLIDGQRSVEDITDVILAELNVESAPVTDDVTSFLEDLSTKGLISWQ